MNDPPARIRQALARIVELDEAMTELDEQISRYQAVLDDPNADGWDRVDAEAKTLPLWERRDAMRGQVMQAIGDVVSAGAVLIKAWRENLIDDIGRELSHDAAPLTRVQTEDPGVLTGRVWNRLYREAVPF